MAVIETATIDIRVKSNAKESGKDFDKLNDSIKKQDGLLARLREQEKTLLANREKTNDPKRIAAYNRELEKTRQSMSQVEKLGLKTESSLSKMNKGLLRVGASLAGAFAIKAIVGDAIKRVVEFEKSISSLSAITGATGADLDKLKRIVKDTAKETKKGGSEVAKAFELVGSAQPALLKNADALALVTKNAITLSKASGLDLTSAVNATTTGLAQFNLSADESEKVIDALAAGAKFGASAIPETTAAIEKFGAVASNANISIQDSVALTETLATKQLTGAEAGNNLKNIILKLQNAGLGFVDGQFNINAALEETKAKFDGIEDPVKRSQEQTKLFGLESATAGAILLDNIDTFKDFSTSIGNDVGGASVQAGIQMDNLSAKVEEMDATYESFLLSVEDGNGVISEFVKGAVDGFTGILESLTELNEFDFDKILNPDGARNFQSSMFDLASTLNGITNPALGDLIERTGAELDKNLDAADARLKNLSETQLENELVIGQLVKGYEKLGLSQQEARNRIREELNARTENIEAIDGESNAIDDNTTSTNTNNKAKEKSLTLLERQKKLQSDFKKELEGARGIQDENITEDDESAKADEALDKFIAREEKKTEFEKEERAKRSEQRAEEFELKQETDRLNEEAELALKQEFAEAKQQIDEQLGFSALALAGAIAQAAGDSIEAQSAALAFEKIAAVASIIINTQKGAAAATGQAGIFGLPIAALIQINGALQVATVLATAIPQAKAITTKKLKDGEVMISGKGTETSDSIPAMLSKNESVINAKSSRKHTAALIAINDDRFDQYLERVYLQKLFLGDGVKINQKSSSKGKSLQFPNGFNVTNTKALAGAIAEAMDNKFVNYNGKWG